MCKRYPRCCEKQMEFGRYFGDMLCLKILWIPEQNMHSAGIHVYLINKKELVLHSQSNIPNTSNYELNLEFAFIRYILVHLFIESVHEYALGRNRTCNHQFRKLVLYPLSYECRVRPPCGGQLFHKLEVWNIKFTRNCCRCSCVVCNWS